MTTDVFACAIVLWALLTAASDATAGDVKSGAALAEKCQVCHGLDGMAKIVEAPNLAGQNEAYLVKQLTAFKTGERQNEMMSVVAPSLSDKDIEDLASYFAAIEITVKVPVDVNRPQAGPASTGAPAAPHPPASVAPVKHSALPMRRARCRARRA